MPAERPDPKPWGFPRVAGGHLPSGYRLAKPASVYTFRLSDPPILIEESPRLRGVPRLPTRPHRRQHFLRLLVLPARPATKHRAGIRGHKVHGTFDSGTSWPPGIACAEVLAIFLLGVVGLLGHAPPLTSSLSLVEAEALPSDRVVLSRSSTVL